MGIELICDEDPWVVWRRVHCLRDVRNEVRFSASLTNAGSDLFSRRNFEVGNQALRTVTNVFVFLAFDLACLARDAWLHRFCRRRAFKRLDAGLLIRAHKMNALRVQCRSLLIKIAHGFDLIVKPRRLSFRGIEPGFNPIRFEIDLILKNARHLPGRCFRRSGV